MTAVLVVLIVGMHTGPAGWWNGRTADAAAATLSSPSRSAAATPSSRPSPSPSPTPSSTPSSTPSPTTTSTPTSAPTVSTGAPSPAPAGAVTLAPSLVLPADVVSRTVDLSYGGYPRSYTTLAPSTGSRGLPMVVFLSGSSAPLGNEVLRDQLLPEVAAGQLSLVYPAALDLHWNIDGTCCTTGKEPKANDAGFVSEVTSLATTGLQPDTTHLYVAGYSAGGRLAWQLVCGGGSPFAAVATYGAAPETSCPSSGAPLPVFIGYGVQDPDEPVAGKPANSQGSHPPAVTNVTTWRARDDCPASPATTTIGGQVTEQAWTSCAAAGTAVTYALWTTGTHVLPNPPGFAVAESFGTLAWAFLHQFTLS
jgi:poly(3-hydroxybutyrate) depolymerase